MNYETILYYKENKIAKIVLNRPKALNALNRTMVSEIGMALDDSEKDQNIRVVVISGKGKAFCAGVDLKFVKEELKSLHDQQEFFRFANKTVIQAIENLEKPVIAAINGYALAGGFELMLVCDFAIAAESAIISDQHINYGLVGSGGSTQRTPKMVGIKKAKELILTGKMLVAIEAEQMGLINSAVKDDQLEKVVNELSMNLAEKSPVAMKIAKRLINRSFHTTDTIGSELEIMAAIVNATSEDYEEGIKAFSEKRKPVFKGR